jgi:hypothetical protein
MGRNHDLVATRTVLVCFAHGKSEYWLTDREFAVGEALEHSGRVWIISEVAGSAVTGGKPRISLTEADGQERDTAASEHGSFSLPLTAEA